MDLRPVGIFDSGLGGLTVVRQVKKTLPSESIIYLGDTARIPYGTRSKEVVMEFAKEDALFLESRGVKCIVVACNTASAQAIDEVTKAVSVPVLNVVTAGVKAVGKDARKIGVIATKGTVSSHAYKSGLGKNSNDVEVYERACSLFVPIIEEGEFRGKLADLLIKKYLDDVRREGVDTLILGCTHYPLLADKIAKFMGVDVVIVDSGVEVAKCLKKLLTKLDLQSDTRESSCEYCVTDLNGNFVEVAEWFLDEKIKGKVQKVSL